MEVSRPCPEIVPGTGLLPLNTFGCKRVPGLSRCARLEKVSVPERGAKHTAEEGVGEEIAQRPSVGKAVCRSVPHVQWSGNWDDHV